MDQVNTRGFPRRILLAVTGLTPQVVTETLYALAVARATPWVPTELHLLTTAEGAQSARLELLDPATGQFHALCRDYGLSGIAFDETHIQVLRDENGHPLADIRTPEDNTRAADLLLGAVRALCNDAQSELHVSIAGGRKTMGFFLGYALSLFGRPQDRLSHVLISPPFESLPEFYFPPRIGRVLRTRDDRPVHTDDARVLLAEIPFVRLREGLPSEALRQEAPFASLVSAAQAAVEPPALRFDFANKRVWCGEKAVTLPPAELAWYAWLAECRMQQRGEAGFMNFRDGLPEQYLALYERITGPFDARLEDARAKLRKNGFESPEFQQRRSKINRKLAQALALAAAPYEIASCEKPARYGIAIAPERIRFA